MKDTNELNLEIERIKGDIKLIEQSLDTIKNNHLFHIENSILVNKPAIKPANSKLSFRLSLILDLNFNRGEIYV